MSLAGDSLQPLAERVLALCRQRGLTLATAESCTGGMVVAALTDIAGSSDVVDRGFVTYSNEAKTDLLGVPPPLLAAVGAVSAEVAAAMVTGALARTRVDLVVAITGIAGPGGGTAAKPVGLVHLACGRRGAVVIGERQVFPGDRTGIRQAATRRALELLESAAGG